MIKNSIEILAKFHGQLMNDSGDAEITKLIFVGIF